MQRKFIVNLVFLLFLNLLIKPFWIFGIDVTVQNRVGAEEYGFYYALFGFSILLNILLDIGITNYNNRNISQYNHMLQRYFSSIVLLKFLLGIVYLIITILFALLLDYNQRAIQLLLLLCFNQFLLSFLLYLRSNVAALQLFKTDSILSILDRVNMIIICAYFLWMQSEIIFTIELFVVIQSVAYLLSCFVALFTLGSKLKNLKFRLKIPLLRIILRQSLPFALLVLLMAFYYRLDAVMIERILIDGKVQAGIYAQAYRLLEAATMIGFLFAGLLLPMFSNMIAKKQATQALVQLSFNLIFAPAFILFVICFFYAENIMQLLYIENVKDSAEVLRLLMLTFVAVASTYIFGTYLTAKGSLKALNIIALIGLAINLVFNMILIPMYKSYGAAIATLITQLFVIIAQVYVVKQSEKWQISFYYILRLSIFLIGMMLIAYFIQTFTLNWIYGVSAILISGLLLSMFTKLIHLKSIFIILKNKEVE